MTIQQGSAAPVPADEPGEIRARLDALGMDAIVDVHTHFMPDQVMRKVWAYFDSAGPLLGRPWPIAYRQPQAERAQILRALHVEWFTSLVYPHKPDMAEWLNTWAAEFAAETPGCLHSATFYPEPEAAAYVAKALDAGARIFKVHVQVGDYDINDPLLDPVWGLLAESGTPIVTHAGDGPAPGRFTGPDGVRELMRRHPRLTLAIAHMGLPDYVDFLDLAEVYPSVHLDTTMAFTDFTEEMAPFPVDMRSRLVELGDRILFGSDFPNIPYSYLHAVDALLRLELGDDWSRAVLGDNARRLLGLPAGDRPAP